MRKSADGYRDGYEAMGDAELVKLLGLGPNIVLVTRGPGWTAESAMSLREALRDDVLLVHLAESGDTIEALDVDAMRAHGWTRTE